MAGKSQFFKASENGTWRQFQGWVEVAAINELFAKVSAIASYVPYVRGHKRLQTENDTRQNSQLECTILNVPGNKLHVVDTQHQLTINDQIILRDFL